MKLHTSARSPATRLTLTQFAMCSCALVASSLWGQAPAGLKGIWEPVNYAADLRFEDVFFVTPEIGYVSGYAGTILKTTDAGATWVAQLGGDPASQERPIETLFFVSPTTGWATQRAASSGRHLYRTTDGEYWETVANINEHLDDLAFATENDGIYVDDTLIRRTTDGGRTWSDVYRCATTAQIGGLTRQIECNFWNVHFATPTVVYALGSGRDVTAALIAKSTDAGASWSIVSVLENQNGSEGGLFFIDENTGYFTTRDAQSSFRTTDGGATWSGMPATAVHRRIVFADPEVGWAMRYNQLSYTTDGGRRWASRTIDFPASAHAFSLPRRDVGYVVGDHGMIYRYRSVPESTPVSANTIAGVAMPPLANGVIEDLGALDRGLADIESAIAAAGDSGSTVDSALGWVESNVPEFAELEATLDAVTAGLPEIGRKHRNLNLVTEGLKLLGDLTGQSGGLAEGFASLRQAKDVESVSSALLALHAGVAAARTSVTAFEAAQVQ